MLARTKVCHGMSYAISGRNKEQHVRYSHADYTHLERPLVPHGISVCLTAPAVFRLTAHASPERHAQALAALAAPNSPHAAADTSPDRRYRDADYVGGALAERLLELMLELRVPLGLHAIGFRAADVDALVAGTLPQRLINSLAHLGEQRAVDAELLGELFRASMKY